MAKVLLEENTAGHFYFICPGCKRRHAVWTVVPNKFQASYCWSYNGNADKPTFMPSLLLQSDWWYPPVTEENLEEWKKNPWEQTKGKYVCHSFITDGRIQFLDDCTHELKGQTVDLPDM